MALLAIASGSAVAEWVQIYADKNQTFFVDPTTIQKHENNIAEVLELIDLQSPVKMSAGLFSREKDIWSYSMVVEVSCEKPQIRNLTANNYDKNMGKGNVVVTSPAEDKWTSFVPAMVAKAVQELACGSPAYIQNFIERRAKAGAEAERKKQEDIQRSIAAQQARENELALERREREKERLAFESTLPQFRKTISIGANSHCGMVIERKDPIVKIQTMTGEKWLRLDQVYPPGTHACQFFNGQYVD